MANVPNPWSLVYWKVSRELRPKVSAEWWERNKNISWRVFQSDQLMSQTIFYVELRVQKSAFFWCRDITYSMSFQRIQVCRLWHKKQCQNTTFLSINQDFSRLRRKKRCDLVQNLVYVILVCVVKETSGNVFIFEAPRGVEGKNVQNETGIKG